jgi:uncharacterized protein YndB with AHSA1/START domain
MNTLTAQVTRTVEATPAQVWSALTTPATLKEFFFNADVESDWQEGHAIRMTGEHQGKSYEDKGEIMDVEVGRRLSFSHWSAMSGAPDTPENYHVVCFDLMPEGTGTKVILTQSNLVGEPKEADIEHRQDYEANWSQVLDGLAKVVGRDKAH